LQRARGRGDRFSQTFDLVFHLIFRDDLVDVSGRQLSGVQMVAQIMTELADEADDVRPRNV
jgi:hypothetical protein